MSDVSASTQHGGHGDGVAGPYAAAGEHVRAVAQSLVELTAGVMQSAAVSLWWYDEEEAHLIARFPEDRMPSVMDFSQVPEVAASIKAEETQLYVRDEATGLVRDWMEQAGIEVSLRLPVAIPEVERHFLGLSWEAVEHPAVDSLLPTARRFADHIASVLSDAVARGGRVESALELSDNVAQALILAKTYLRLGRQDDAEQALERALDETQRIMGRLLGDHQSGNLRRLYPSNVMGGRPATGPTQAELTRCKQC
jgi:hypothetical protein